MDWIESAVSREIQDRAGTIEASGADRERWLRTVVDRSGRRRGLTGGISRKILPAAALCVLLLAGFGFGFSRFGQLFINAEAEDTALTNALWEYQASGRINGFLAGLLPGEAREAVWPLDNGKNLRVFAVRGDNVSRITYGYEGEEASKSTVQPNITSRMILKHQATGDTVQDYIARGEFIAALEGEAYRFVSIDISEQISSTRVIYYAAKQGNIKLAIHPYQMQFLLNEETQVEEVRIGDRVWFHILHSLPGGHKNSELVLPLGEEEAPDQIITLNGGTGFESLLEAAKHLVLYNEPGTADRVMADIGSLLEESGSLAVRRNREGIVEAVLPMHSRGGAGVAWQAEGITVSVMKQEYGAGSLVLSVREQHSAVEALGEGQADLLIAAETFIDLPEGAVQVEEQITSGGLSEVAYRFAEEDISIHIDQVHSMDDTVRTPLDALIYFHPFDWEEELVPDENLPYAIARTANMVEIGFVLQAGEQYRYYRLAFPEELYR